MKGINKKNIQAMKEEAALAAIEEAGPEADKQVLRDSFAKHLEVVSIHKIKVFLDANKHFLNTQGIHVHDPTSKDGLTWEIVFTGKHKNGKIAAIRIELSDDDMKDMKDDDVFNMMGKACWKIKEFKEGSGLEVGGLVV